MKLGSRTGTTTLWDAQIRTLCEQGQLDRALDLLFQSNVQLRQHSYISLLRVCHRQKALPQAKLLHTHLLPHLGLTLNNSIVGEYLVLTLAKCGAIQEALQVFQSLPCRSVHSWTALIAAFAECGRSLEVLRMRTCMQEEGVEPNEYTFVSFLKACNCPSLIDEGRQLHAQVCQNDLETDIFITSALVSMYSKCSLIAEAEDVFGASLKRDIVLWNAMLSAYVENKQGEKVLLLYRQMQKEHIIPDQYTFLMALQPSCSLSGKGKDGVGSSASTTIKSLQIGRALHADARKRGFDLDIFVGTALVTMYAKCGVIQEAEHAFVTLSQYDITSWNAMLSAYVEQCQGHKALQLYDHMQKHNVIVDDATLTSVLQACIDVGSTVGREVHFTLVSASLELDLVLAAALIHAYGSHASMTDARVILDCLTNPDAVSWTACLAGFARIGDCTAGLDLFELSIQLCISPDGVLFGSVLSACSLGGLVDEGLHCIQFMAEECGLARDLNHYNLMTDLLGRAGDFKRVESVLRATSTQADLPFWLSLLGLCSIHRNVELGSVAFDHAQKLQPEEALSYVLMSNIYRAHPQLY